MISRDIFKASCSADWHIGCGTMYRKQHPSDTTLAGPLMVWYGDFCFYFSFNYIISLNDMNWSLGSWPVSAAGASVHTELRNSCGEWRRRVNIIWENIRSENWDDCKWWVEMVEGGIMCPGSALISGSGPGDQSSVRLTNIISRADQWSRQLSATSHNWADF